MKYRRELDDTGQPFVLEFRTTSGLMGWQLAEIALLGVSLLVLAWFFFQSGYRRFLSVLELASEREGLERSEALSLKNEEIRRLAGKVVDLQENDYRHIARELHDEFGQCITAIAINTKLVADRLPVGSDERELSLETQSLVDHLLNVLHSLIRRLRPESLDMFGLSAAILNCADPFKFERLEIDCQVELDPAIDALSDTYAITVYRAVQELLNNVVKHADAKSVRVSVRLSESRVLIEVVDDGRGMSPDAQASGYGLTGAVERLAAFEGELRFSRRQGGGCRAEALLPWGGEANEYIRIILVDDHAIVRAGFARLLADKDRFKVVEQLSSGQAAIDFVRNNPVDVAVVDINMAGMDGLIMTVSLKALAAGLKVIILSVNEVEPFISKSFESGADAFLSKRCAPEELSDAIAAVCEGKQYLSRDMRRQLAMDRASNKVDPLSALTRREFEVFLCLARGDTMIDIASKLNISPKTGYVFRGKIMNKLDITKLADLIQLAHSHKLI